MHVEFVIGQISAVLQQCSRYVALVEPTLPTRRTTFERHSLHVQETCTDIHGELSVVCGRLLGISAVKSVRLLSFFTFSKHYHELTAMG